MDLKQVSGDVLDCHCVTAGFSLGMKTHWALRFSFRRDTKLNCRWKKKIRGTISTDIKHPGLGPAARWHQVHAPLSSGARCSACFGAERKVLTLPNTDSSYPPVCPFPETHLPSHLFCRKRVVRVLPESSELLHAAPKYATADDLCFSFCISVTHLLQKPTSEVLFWITGGNQTHGGWTQQHNCLLKFCAKFKANCSRWSADAR